uniref:Vasculin n=1 Tax=Gongylonema pulchrum TaxID=637853 RepID=A0A183ENK5_9BILA
LEHRWICEGVESRSNANTQRKEKLKVEALEGDATVLSPQRRGFSLGCRAASPKNEGEVEKYSANKANWRSGAGFQLKNSGVEHKASLSKGAGGGSLAGNGAEHSSAKARMHNNNNSLPGGWRSNDPSFKSNHQKEGGGGGYKNKASGSAMDEKIPEWLNDGPKSMHDMIELRGFDEDSSKNTKCELNF